MRKKAAQPTRKHPTSSSQPSELIVNELKPGRSDGEKSALDDRSHRTSGYPSEPRSNGPAPHAVRPYIPVACGML